MKVPTLFGGKGLREGGDAAEFAEEGGDVLFFNREAETPGVLDQIHDHGWGDVAGKDMPDEQSPFSLVKVVDHGDGKEKGGHGEK